MPIKMTGSVRPTSLTSPDPISMPIINKLPALKAKVIDIRDNGPGTPTAIPSPYATGLLVETDWQANGDTLATLHTTTGLEWLDLSQTYGMSVDQVTGLLSTTFAGWRLPTYEEVGVLMDSFTHNPWPAIRYLPGTQYNLTEADDWLAKIGSPTVGIGLHYHTSPSTSCTLSGIHPAADYIYYGRLTYSSSDGNNTASGSTAGVWLVSDGGTTLSSQNNPNINTPGA